jgi:hypothetical protein
MSVPAGSRDRGRITPGTFDLLRRSAVWMKLAAALAFLTGASALAGGLFLLGGLVGGPFAEDSPQRGLLGGCLGLATACLAGAWPLYCFGVACQEPLGPVPEVTEGNLEEAFRSLRVVWLRTAAAALIALCAWGILALTAGPAPPPPTAPVDRTGHLRAVEAVEEDGPPWTAPPKEVSVPGRALGFDDLPAACTLSWRSYLCLLNVGGDEVAGGSRRVLRKDARLEPPGFNPARPNQVTLSAEGWSLTVAPPPGAPWQQGDYDTASPLPHGYDQSLPYFRLVTSDSRCPSEQSGRFRVVSVQRRPDDGSLSAVEIDFEAVCGGWKLTGRFAAAR